MPRGKTKRTKWVPLDLTVETPEPSHSSASVDEPIDEPVDGPVDEPTTPSYLAFRDKCQRKSALQGIPIRFLVKWHEALTERLWWKLFAILREERFAEYTTSKIISQLARISIDRDLVNACDYPEICRIRIQDRIPDHPYNDSWICGAINSLDSARTTHFFLIFIRNGLPDFLRSPRTTVTEFQCWIYVDSSSIQCTLDLDIKRIKELHSDDVVKAYLEKVREYLETRLANIKQRSRSLPAGWVDRVGEVRAKVVEDIKTIDEKIRSIDDV